MDDTNRRELLSLGLAALPAVNRQPTRLQQVDVARISERTHALEEWDRRSGGRTVLHYTRAELQRTLDLGTTSMTPSVRTAWTAAVAALAGLVAWTGFDAGADPDGTAFRLGATAARQAGDSGVLCHITSNWARQEIHHRRPHAALDLLDSVSAGALPLTARAMLSAVRAQAHAALGETRAVTSHLLAAERWHARVTDPAGQPTWTHTITASKVASDGGFAWWLLADATGQRGPALTEQLRDSLAQAQGGQARVRAMTTARLAGVLYQRGDRDEADHYASSAVNLAVGISSIRLGRSLVEMKQAALLAR
ncbi:hypothetical protein [Streptacidiphilus sp. EB103A]|uniref:hypothetical protein n=1 Tax=Streptacidiphilus sp. EB103A TaxID=3156275 RepID=UPI003516AA86